IWRRVNARICGRAATDRFLLLGWPSADALSPSDFCRFLGRLTGEDTKTGHIQDRGKGPCKPQRHVVKLLALMGALGGVRAAGGGSPYPVACPLLYIRRRQRHSLQVRL